MSVSPLYVAAPMAGMTDKPFRRLIRRFSDHLLFTEMIGIDALARHHPVTERLLDLNGERNIGVQLVGRDPALFAQAAKRAEDAGAVWIDINMGCPVKKLIANGSGAALMKNPDAAADIVTAVKKSVRLPVSVKIRLGWDDAHLNAADFARRMREAGADRVTVHARTRAQLYGGQARPMEAAAVCRALDIPVLINGDITSPESARDALARSGAAGAMIGRALIGQPWFLAFLETGQKPVFSERDLVLEHFDALLSHYGPAGLFVFRKYIAFYGRGKKELANFCRNVYAETEPRRVRPALARFFDKTSCEREKI